MRWLPATRTLGAAIFLVANCAFAATKSPQPPKTFIDEGACPFECCTYGEWVVKKDTPLLKHPDDDADVVGSALKDTRVKGLTGRVIVTAPGRIEVLRPYTSGTSGKSYQPGDIVWVYTERGEGFFNVWFDGQMYDEEAFFLYQGRGGSDQCVEDQTCWGKEKEFPKSVWWVKVKTPKGVSGWSKLNQNFGNMDACGSAE